MAAQNTTPALAAEDVAARLLALAAWDDARVALNQQRKTLARIPLADAEAVARGNDAFNMAVIDQMMAHDALIALLDRQRQAREGAGSE